MWGVYILGILITSLRASSTQNKVTITPAGPLQISVYREVTVRCDADGGIGIAWEALYRNEGVVLIPLEGLPPEFKILKKSESSSMLILNTSTTDLIGLVCKSSFNLVEGGLVNRKATLNLTIYGVPDSPSSVSIELDNGNLVASWDFLGPLPVQFQLNVTFIALNKFVSLLKIVDDTLFYNFTNVRLTPCEVIIFCIAAINDVDSSDPSCTERQSSTLISWHNEDQELNICTTSNQIYKFKCHFFNTCNVAGCTYVITGKNVKKIKTTFLSNETFTQRIDDTLYNHVTMYDSNGNLVMNRSINFREVGRCSSTTDAVIPPATYSLASSSGLHLYTVVTIATALAVVVLLLLLITIVFICVVKQVKRKSKINPKVSTQLTEVMEKEVHSTISNSGKSRTSEVVHNNTEACTQLEGVIKRLTISESQPQEPVYQEVGPKHVSRLGEVIHPDPDAPPLPPQYFPANDEELPIYCNGQSTD